MNSIKFSLICLILSTYHNVSAQEITEHFIDSIVERSMDLMPQAGVAVAVIKDGEVIHAKGYGVTSTISNEKVDENTLFAIASNSKAFTTMALGMLVDEGKMNWTDKVVDYIPEFRMYEPYVTENFNIQDLLTHRSGLGLGAGDLMFFPSGSDFTIDDILRSFQYQTPTSAFRTKYDYDNLLYIVSGEVIKRISGMEWEDFVKERIFDPLNMTRTAGLYNELNDKSNLANPHKVEDGKAVEFDGHDKSRGLGAAGGIYSSVTDLTKWMIMHLNGGVYGDSSVLISEANHNEMWKAHTMIWYNAIGSGTYNSHYSAYGLGWGIADQGGKTILSHTGGLPGMLSSVTLIPEMNAGVVVLTNCLPGGYSFATIRNEIKDALLGVEERDWVGDAKGWLEAGNAEEDSVLNAVWTQVEKSKKTKINMEDYVGIYKDDWFGEISVEIRDKELWFVSKRSPMLTGKMGYYQANTFAIHWKYDDMECDAFASFSLDENGIGQSIKMKGISPGIDFSFDFHDLDLRRINKSN